MESSTAQFSERWRPSLSGASEREPAHGNVEHCGLLARGCCAPFEPPALRAAADAAGGRCVPQTRLRCAPRGPPHRHGYRPRQRPAEHAAYEVAAAVGGAAANVDRVRHGHWARAEPPSRARSATIGTSPPLGEHARRSGARASLGGSKGRSPSCLNSSNTRETKGLPVHTSYWFDMSGDT